MDILAGQDLHEMRRLSFLIEDRRVRRIPHVVCVSGQLRGENDLDGLLQDDLAIVHIRNDGHDAPRFDILYEQHQLMIAMWATD